jgi:hypothetical protein
MDLANMRRQVCATSWANGSRIALMLPLHFFDRYRTALLALPVLQPDEHYSRNQLISDAFRIFRANGLDVFYAPFHYSNPRAKVALVGLTPGFTQMANAFRAAKEAQRAGLSGTELFAHINRAVAILKALPES